MKRDPVRLLDDPGAPGTMKAGLALLRETKAPYDSDAGYASFMAALGAGAAALTTSSTVASSATSTAASSVAVNTATGLSAGAKVVLAMTLATGTTAAAVWLNPSRDDPPTVTVTSTAMAPQARSTASADIGTSPTLHGDGGTDRNQVVRAPAPTASVRAPTRPNTPSTGPSIDEETQELARLRAIATSDPGRAVSLADAQHARFSRGIFFQEREAIAILALQRLGRADEANARAKRFAARFPESPFVEALTGERK
jgi:hypothetical protein